MLTPLLLVKLIAEIALLSLLGRAAMVVLTRGQPEANWVYRLFHILSQPFVRLVAWFSPRFVLAQHHPLATFCLLGVIWLLVTMAKIQLCLQLGVQACR